MTDKDFKLEYCYKCNTWKPRDQFTPPPDIDEDCGDTCFDCLSVLEAPIHD